MNEKYKLAIYTLNKPPNDGWEVYIKAEDL